MNAGRRAGTGRIPCSAQRIRGRFTRTSGAAFGTDQALVPAFHFDDDFDGLRPGDDFLHLPRRLQAQEFGDEFPGHHHSVGTRFVAEGGAAALGIAARVSAGMGRANSR